MVKNTRRTQRGEDALSRERIIDAAIELLDAEGETGLTFRALAERLATGAGAIYWHVANKGDLLVAAGDAVLAGALAQVAADAAPRAAIRAIGLALFDALDDHPWVGATLTQAPGAMPLVRILEGVGRPVAALGVPAPRLWAATSALLSYMLGVAGQNAANRRTARAQALDRDDVLGTIADAWLRLDPDAFPFTRGVAGQLRAHDDRADFLAGIDLFLDGIEAARPAARSRAGRAHGAA